MNHTPWTVSEIPPQTGRLRPLFQLKGEPVLVEIPKPARDETAGRHTMGRVEEDRSSFRRALLKLE